MAEKLGVLSFFDTSEFSKGINEYISGLSKARKQTTDTTGGMTKRWNDAAQRWQDGSSKFVSANQAAGASARRLGNVVDIAFGNIISNAVSSVVNIIPSFAGAISSLGGEGLQAVSSYERLSLSLESLAAREIVSTGGAANLAEAQGQASERAAELLGWIQQLALQSPFSQEGVAIAFRTAQSYGFASDEAQRLTAALIDYAAASGGTEDVMQGIALALGQIQAKGKLSGEEVAQLVERGIAVDQILADAFGKSTAEIVKMREKGLIPANDAIRIIVESLERDFGGAAARQANTFAGLVASLEDVKEVGLREFFTSTFEPVKPLLTDIVNILSSPAFTTALSDLGARMGQFVSNAFEFGIGVAVSFADGIASGIGFVANAVEQIGSIITFWMSPGSPPRFLPNVDKWGADTMTTYMDGWSNADFSVFDDLTRQIEKGLRDAVSTGELAEVDVIPNLLGARTSLAEAIDEISRTGNVSQDTFNRIIESAGAKSP